MPKAYLIPNPDKKIDGQIVRVYDPTHKDFLPETGRNVHLNAYWLNRLRNKEVVRGNGAVTVPEKSELELKLESMTKAEIVAFAKSEFGIDLNKNDNKPTLIQLVIAEKDLHND